MPRVCSLLRAAMLAAALGAAAGLRPRLLAPTRCAAAAAAFRRGRAAAATQQEQGANGAAAGGGDRQSLLQLNEEELAGLIKELGQPKFRAKQIREWVYEKGEVDYGNMSNLPAKLQVALAERLPSASGLEVAVQQESKDGTIKRALRLPDGQLIEAVLMPYDDGRRTACISSQAGCGMRCSFCATGQMGFSRQLTAGEIFAQAAEYSCQLKRKGERLSNVVFMGMGEPLANYKNVMDAVRRINGDLGIGARHITISTVGIAPRIRRLSRDVESKAMPPVTLAVSLHAATDAARSAIMPVNDRYDLGDLLGACKEYVGVTGRRMTFEWALIDQQNDEPEEADRLATLLIQAGLKGLCHVNVIPLNPTGGFAGRPSQTGRVNAFLEKLEGRGIPATARVRRGIDIDAGCGQLKSEVLKKEKEAGPDAGTEADDELEDDGGQA
mmetsp:Transcript_9848/g.28932  ORF Transcript_9848/g.28932 Transcript_9848/m.28932 type:complete len:441 (-) Transcript_9848:43-1365(-)